jgi:hypothetical protein
MRIFFLNGIFVLDWNSIKILGGPRKFVQAGKIRPSMLPVGSLGSSLTHQFLFLREGPVRPASRRISIRPTTSLRRKDMPR